MQNLEKLKELLSKSEIPFEENVPLAPFTTYKIGGPAEILVKSQNSDMLVTILKISHGASVPVTLLGWGSNVLISDKGIKGLVVINKMGSIKVLDRKLSESDLKKMPTYQPKARLIQAHPEEYYDFSDIDYPEDVYPRVLTELESGLSLQAAINSLIAQGVTGLQWFSGIPGTIGGAIYNNIHGGTHFFSEFIFELDVADRQGNIKTLSAKEISNDYDFSRFHESGEIILRARLLLFRGDKERAQKTSIMWATRKKLQPHNTAGCIFQNLNESDKESLKLESNGMGYVTDKILGLKGKRIGDAQISNKHAAFIENLGHASAEDVLELIRLIQSESIKKIGLKPQPEIFFLGFEENQIKEVVS